jgi:putative CocE/NonD family hydrolase
MSDSAAGSDAWKRTPDQYLAEHPPAFTDGLERFSRYVSVRDGTRLAVDVHFPVGKTQSFPTLLIFTPYYRRFKLANGHPADTEDSPNTGHYRNFFVPHGYAVVVVDVRGTGASFGSRDGFRSPTERNDYYDITEWVVDQPWCDGRIGSTGISYVGAAADFLASTGHPAIKGVIPTFAVWDTYSDHFYPGGLLLGFLPPAYNALMEALDLDRRDALKSYAYFANPGFEGPAPVDEDEDASLRDAAIVEHHANVDANDFIRELAYSDSGLSYAPEYTSASISPYHYSDHVHPETAYCCVSGWMDGGGYGNAAVKRYLSLEVRNKHLILGPWDHGARTNVSPFRENTVPEFNLLAESLRFFDHYVRGVDTGLDDEQPVHFFTMAEERWHAADTWPPPQSRGSTTYLAADGALDSSNSGEPETDEYTGDYGCGTGNDTRYERLRAAVVHRYYGDWHRRDARMLCYTSEPLSEDTEMSGHPVLNLRVSVSERDAAFFSYLEDVTPEGECRYVTEGVLRALHRKVSEAPAALRCVGPYHSFARGDTALLSPGEPTEIAFSLFPTSWLFRRGHRIRLAIALADRDHYVRVPGGRLPVITVHRGGSTGSTMELPLRERPRTTVE